MQAPADTIISGAGMMNNKWRGIRKGWEVKIKLSICEDNITVNLGNTRELKDKLTIATETTKYIGSNLTGNARYLWKKNFKPLLKNRRVC